LAYHRVKQVHRKIPPAGGAVQRLLLADGEVELGLERVEQQVDLVEQRDATLVGAPHLDHLGHLVRGQVLLGELAAHPRQLGRRAAACAHLPPRHEQLLGRRLDDLQRVDVLEHEGLDRLGRRADDRLLLPRALQLVAERHDALEPVHRLVGALEGEGVDPLVDDVGEAVAQHRARHLEQRRRAHL
jgi:hypothetical protein